MLVVVGFLGLAGLFLDTRLLAIAVGAGCLFAAVASHQASRWPVEQWNAEISGEFTIVGFPSVRGTQVTFLAHRVGAASLPKQLRLSWYRTDAVPRPGERWHLRVRMRPPRGGANPGGFHYERWLASQRIGATGYVVADPGNRRIAPAAPGSVAATRNQLRSRVIAALPDGRQRAVVLGLALGDRSEMDPAIKSEFRRTGTAHLMAISGLHVGLVAGLALAAMRLLSRCWLLVTKRPASRVIPAVVAFCAALVYGQIAGFGLPVQRACLMSGVLLFCWAAGQRILAGRSFAIALLLLFLVDPMSVYSVGFFLSFGAVAALGLLAGRDVACRSLPSKWRRAIRWQCGLSLIMAPLTLVLMGQVSLIGPLANLLLIPWFSLVVVPAVLLGAVASLAFGIEGAWLFVSATISPSLWLLGQLADLPLAWFEPGAPGEREVLALLGVAIAVLLPIARRVRFLLLIPLASIAWPSPEQPPAANCLQLQMFDVGQGLAALVQTSRFSLLYDTGPAYPGGGSAAESVLLPALAALDVRHLDAIVVSHADSDHAGGLDVLRQRFVQANVIRSSAPGENERRCVAGMSWVWDGFQFKFLAPGATRRAARAGNRDSCVLQIRDRADRGVLLALGDIGHRGERELVAQHADLQSAVVIVSHHGSATSSSLELVRATAPTAAWVAAGFRNRWGFPHEDVAARWEGVGAVVAASGDLGALGASWCDGHLRLDRGYRTENPDLTRLPAVISRP